MQERLYRLRFVPKELSQRSDNRAKQSCGYRLFKMHGMRHLHAKVSAKVHQIGGIIRLTVVKQNIRIARMCGDIRENRENKN